MTLYILIQYWTLFILQINIIFSLRALFVSGACLASARPRARCSQPLFLWSMSSPLCPRRVLAGQCSSVVFGFMHSLIFKSCGKMERGRWEGEERDMGYWINWRTKSSLSMGLALTPVLLWCQK